MNSPEHEIQKAFIEWVHWQEKIYPGLEWSFAVPNGANRGRAAAGKSKAEGQRKGVIDWLCCARRNGFSGVGIEFKYGRNKPTAEQRDFIAHLRDEGWFVEVCYTTEEAINVVTRYFQRR